MKNLVILVLVIVAIASQVFGQTKKEKIDLVESQIKTVSSDLKKSEKDFERSKAKQLAEWKKELRGWQIRGSRSDNKDEIATALKATTQLKSQIDSLTALKSNDAIDAQREFLESWKGKKNELMAQFVEADASEKVAEAKPKPTSTSVDSLKLAAKAAKEAAKEAEKEAREEKEKLATYDRAIPTEVRRVSYNRRNNSHDLRGNEIVLAQIEQNINSAISPGAPQGGYKVIFDNMYITPVNFIVKSTGGMARKAIVLGSNVRQTEFLLPGKYTVELYVNGRLSGCPRPLVIDGQSCTYQGETCFGFVYAPRF